MTIFSGRRHGGTGRTGWIAWLAVLALVVAVPMASAQTETVEDLANGDEYATVDLTGETSPQTIGQAIALSAFGDDTGTLSEVYYYAEGVYSADVIDITNTYSVDVTATAGVALVGPFADADVVANGFLLENGGDLDNSGDITVSVVGGMVTADAETGEGYAQAEGRAEAEGIYIDGGDLTNSGNVSTTATGSSVTATSADSYAYAYAQSYNGGIYVEYGDITNSGDVSAVATGGGASATAANNTAYAYSSTSTYGIEDYSGNISNEGAVTSTATAGNVTATGLDAYSGATSGAVGIESRGSSYEEDSTSAANVNNSGDITVASTAGTATATADDEAYARAYAGAYGIIADGGADTYADSNDAYGNVVNTGSVDVSAASGVSAAEGYYAYADSYAYAAGIINYGGGGAYDYDTTDGVGESDAFGNVDNSGDIAVSAMGNTATATGEIYAYANTSASASGISEPYYFGPMAYAEVESDVYGADTSGNVTNSGAVTVDAVAGSATTSSEYYTYTLATASAVGIETEAGVYNYLDDEEFVDEDLDTAGNIENTGILNVTATGGNVTSTIAGDYDAYAYANSYVYAQGIDAWGEEYYGYFGIDEIDSAGNVNNSADITVAGTAGDVVVNASATDYVYAYGVDAYAEAGGIDAEGEGYSDAADADSFGTVTNSGNLAVTAEAGDSTITATLTPDNYYYYDLDAESWADAWGIWADGYSDGADYSAEGAVDNTDSYGDVVNEGDVTVTATAGNATATAAVTYPEVWAGDGYGYAYADAEAWAEGIYAEGEGYSDTLGNDSFGNVTNNGAVTVTATGGDATATAVGEDSSAYDTEAVARSGAYATGIETWGYMYSYYVEGEDEEYVDDGTDSAGNVINTGDVTVTATAGNATATSTGGNYYSLSLADANARAEGIVSTGGGEGFTGDMDEAGNIENSGAITVTATAGDATAIGTGEDYYYYYYYYDPYAGTYANSFASAVGLSARSGWYGDGSMGDADGSDAGFNVTNSGAITVTATGGNATATAVESENDYTWNPAARAVSNAEATGISTIGSAYYTDTDVEDVDDNDYGTDTYGNVDNTGDITVTATAGTATATSTDEAYASASAYAMGIGEDYYDYYYYGGYYGDLGSANGYSDLYGSDAFGNVTNTGAVNVTATGGDATATVESSADTNINSYYANAYSSTYAYGMEMYASVSYDSSPGEDVSYVADGTDTYATITNSGDVTVTATSGNATASALTADSDYTEAYANAGAGAYAIDTYGNNYTYYTEDGAVDAAGTVDNSGAIAATATAGNASATSNRYANAYATAYAGGIDAYGYNSNGDMVDIYGDVNNTGDVTITTTAGTATAEVNAVSEAYDDANAYARAYTSASGIEASGNMTNSGGITVSATAGGASASASEYVDPEAEEYHADSEASSSSYAYATGIGGEFYMAGSGALAGYGGYYQSYVVNTGDVTVTATAANAEATAADDAYADAEAGAAGIVGTQVNNNAAVSVTATAGDASAAASEVDNAYGSLEDIFAYAEADAVGIESYGSLSNHGVVTVAATAGDAVASATLKDEEWGEAYAGRLYDMGYYMIGTEYDGNFVNASAEAIGLYAEGTVTNDADLNIAATAGMATATANTAAYSEASAYATGIEVYSGSVSNSGAITVAATAGTAEATTTTAPETDPEDWPLALALTGARALGIANYSGSVENSGMITVTATGGSADTFAEPYVPEETEEPAEEEEAISVDYFNPSDIAAGIAGVRSYVNNSGDISATVTASAITTNYEDYDNDGAYAFGIAFVGGGSLTNTGVLRSFGDNAYEVGVASGTVTMIDTYNMTLDGDPTVGSLWAYDGAAYNLNNAELTVTLVDDVTQWETEYAIFDTSEGGTVEGAFSGLADPANPQVIATYLDQGTAGSADDGVILTYEPYEGGSPFAEGADIMRQTSRIAFGMVNQRQSQGYLAGLMADAGYTSALRLFADAGTSVSDAGLGYSGGETLNGFYLTPYMAGISKRDEEPVGYDADVMGFILGYDRKVGDNLFGAFVGYSQTEVDYKGLLWNANDEDQDQFSLGASALVPIADWTVRGQLGAFFGSHDFEGLTGIDMDVAEVADYDSSGFGLTLMGGYPIEKDKHLFLPELGVELLYAKLDGFTSNVEGASNWEIESGSDSATNFSAVLNFQWMTELEIGGVAMMPSVSVGMRHLLTDEVLGLTQSIGGSSPYTVESTQNKTSGTGSASLRFGKNALTAEIGYAGELGDESTVNNLWLQVYYNF